MIKRNLEIEISISPQELAKEFCDLTDDEQAEFFNEIAEIFLSWDTQFIFQLQYIVDSKKITKQALQIMTTIGEYAEGALSEKNNA